MGITPNQEVDHEVVLLVKFRRFGIPGDERQLESFTQTARRSLELTFGDGLQSVAAAHPVQGIMYCTAHDDTSHECNDGTLCGSTDAEPGNSCTLTDIFYEGAS